MGRQGTRRTFMTECSTSAAAIAALAASPAGATDAVGGTPYLCVTCGTQFAESARPPAHCPICEDERQYVNPDGGQKWTTLEALRASHRNVIRKEEDRLYSINTEPKFGIGQRAFLIRADGGNVLWDCVGPIDDATIAKVKELGGIAEIAISHPHYYTSMVEWSRAFGGAPIHLHEAERPWVMRPDPAIRFWTGESLQLRGGLKLVRTGGHFEGYQVLHWPAGAGGKGALLAGDQPQICMDPKQVTFMYSYPNYIPLNDSQIRRIVECLDPLPFDRIYGAFFTRGKGIIPARGKEIVLRSADRYLRAIRG
jgi:glyoxylase-like metal-dependent hydrolase (beta-lactamase superfamily II)